MSCLLAVGFSPRGDPAHRVLFLPAMSEHALHLAAPLGFSTDVSSPPIVNAPPSTAASIRVRRADSPRDVDAFVRFAFRVYRNDPNWVAPLVSMQKDKLDTRRNPFWKHATRTLFLALRGDEVVGTIAAIVDHKRPESVKSEGMFGFFESIDDADVARALLDAASRELRSHGMTRMIGPFSPNASDEYGILVEGFDTRPALMEAHSPRYYGALMEACGMEKLRDAYAWLVKTKPETKRAEELLPARIGEVAKRIREAAGVRTRAVDMNRWDEEIATITRLFNASLSTIPDFVPVTLDEFRAVAESLKSFLDPDLIRFVERDGEPVAFALALPDINEALQAANGSLFPTGAIKIWWKQRRLTRASFKILGVLPKYRHRGYDAVLVLDVAQAIIDKGYTEADLSMTGEENVKINGYLQALGLEIYRRVRIYSRSV